MSTEIPCGSPSRASESTPKTSIPRRVQENILQKVSQSRVSIIVGPTGCGKSTLVPTSLLDGLGSPVLCTQPRRLAVVAIAKRVASMRGAVLGQSVGYHVGQNNMTTNNTELVFATAGILMEDLRSRGVNALKRYSCVIIDECHERSSESDCCLAIIRQLMISYPSARIRIVLMSATFNRKKYRDYFKGVPGCENVDTISLESAESFATFYENVQTYYLEDIASKLRDLKTQHAVWHRLMRSDPDEDLKGTDEGKSLSGNLIHLISSLVKNLNKEEPEEAPFLIFAPTYRHLEQIYSWLKSTWDAEECQRDLSLAVLHSSIDIEDCLRSMIETDDDGDDNDDQRSHPRRVLLASAIADSSVTIPGVTCVIDTCRSLEVSWDYRRCSHVAKTVWASKSICEQRRGRTGRTCPGRVFRLLPQSVYEARLKAFETPQLTLSDCRKETMALLCSSCKDITNPASLLNRCLDPPPKENVSEAIQYLKDIGACFETGRQRSKLQPTEYGILVSSLPFRISDSRAILTAGQHGLLYEMLLFQAIMSTRPFPVVHYFGEEEENARALQKYKNDVDPKDDISCAFAHMSAFMFWDWRWNGARRRAAFQLFHELTCQAGPKPVGSFVSPDELFHKSLNEWKTTRTDCGVWQWTPASESAHVAWCKKHEINPTSCRAIADTLDVVTEILFRADCEPEWLRCCETEPIWRRTEAWKSIPVNPGSIDTLRYIYGRKLGEITSQLKELCGAAPPASSAGLLEQILKAQLEPSRIACVHFLNGHCKFGSTCRNSHSLSAKRPVCRYFLSGRCSKGKSCMLSHDPDHCLPTSGAASDPLEPLVPMIDDLFLTRGALGWFRKAASNMLLLGDESFQFFRALSVIGATPRMSTAREDVAGVVGQRKLDSDRVRGNTDPVKLHLDEDLMNDVGSQLMYCAWNFPSVESEEEEEQGNEELMLATFLSLALFFGRTKHNLDTPAFGIAFHRDQLSRWSVLRAARRASWRLKAWSLFDVDDFPGYRPIGRTGTPISLRDARFYVFELHENLFGL